MGKRMQKIENSWSVKFSGFERRKRSFISAFSICVTVPLKKNSLSTLVHESIQLVNL